MQAWPEYQGRDQCRPRPDLRGPAAAGPDGRAPPWSRGRRPAVPGGAAGRLRRLRRSPAHSATAALRDAAAPRRGRSTASAGLARVTRDIGNPYDSIHPGEER
ncbi:hypothetical protein ACRAWD_28165 [Caulobacter segnis]